MKIELPYKINLNGKKYYCNLNNYRNWNRFVEAKVKKKFCNMLFRDLHGVKFDGKLFIRYHFYHNNGTHDCDNICIVQKYFHDALTHYKCIAEDSTKYIKGLSTVYSGYSKDVKIVAEIIEV